MPTRPELKGSKVLVTGGAGFIGSHLVDGLIAAGAAEVVVIDNLFVGSMENLEQAQATGRLTFYKDDAEIATSLHYIMERHAIDVVFNCATKPLNYSFLNPENAYSTNVTVVLNLLELQRQGRFKTLCHVSSSEVYGTAVYEPMDEGHPRNATTTYAAGKAAADLAVESYVRMFELDAFIVRPFNNYGPRQNHTGPLAAIIPLTIFRIMNGIPPEIHGDGEQSRDFIHVEDTVDAMLKVYALLPAGEEVNLSTDNSIRIADLIPMICCEMNYDGEIRRMPARGSDVFCHNGSNEKLRNLVSDLRFTPFEDGLRQTAVWYRDLLAPALGSDGARR